MTNNSFLRQKSFVDGPRAWMAALACSCIFMLTLGSIRAYGEMYAELVSYSPSNSKTIIGLQSTAFAIENGIGSLAVFLNKQFGSRAALLTAGIVTSLGYIICAIVATTLPILMYITYGILIGFGGGMAFMNTQLIVSQYFQKYLAFAMAIVMCGSSVGMLFWPFVFRRLFEAYSIRGGLLLIGAICLHICCLSLLATSIPVYQENDLVIVENQESNQNTKAREETSQTEEYLDLPIENDDKRLLIEKNGNKFLGSINRHYKISLTEHILLSLFSMARLIMNFLSDKVPKIWRFLKTPNFAPYFISRLLVMPSLTLSLVLIAAYALEIGLTITDVAQLTTALGAGETVGKLFFGALASLPIFRGRSVHLYISMITIFSISSLLVSFSSNFLGLLAYSIVAGFWGFSSFSIMPMIFADALGTTNYAEFYAFSISCSSIASVISIYIADWLQTLTDSWTWPIRYIGIVSMISLLPLVMQQISKLLK